MSQKTALCFTLFAFLSSAYAEESSNLSNKIASMNIRTQSELTWIPLNPQFPDMAKFAVVSGNPQTGPSTMLMSFTPVLPGSPVGGLHKHSNAYTTVVLAGTPKHGPSPEEAISFSPGSYWNQPGNEAHYDVCEGTEPCVILTYWTDIRDYFPAEEKDSTLAWKGVLADQVVWEKGTNKKSKISVASENTEKGTSVQFTKYAAGYKSKVLTSTTNTEKVLISGNFQYGTDSLLSVNPGDIIFQPSNQSYIEACTDECILVTISHGM